jgi:hypothetical protein
MHDDIALFDFDGFLFGQPVTNVIPAQNRDGRQISFFLLTGRQSDVFYGFFIDLRNKPRACFWP